jgi:hypothetical protein
MAEETAVREIRVRREYAALYPELAVDEWVAAGEFAKVIVQRARTARSLSVYRRTLDQRHFEFRGGAPGNRHSKARTRSTD